ncbi:CPBP family intramembrane glutamic endopeptidase [uncultured Gulosibacter sp.]|uniref:CPBP family intramembrane glutamic endopeptidase n=1 Tax=uncultured Gulosibacter sp. TaxID=1339167 RepID=UPI00288A73DB|nr:CPBP family intramembrane glutamic endopeptidase [uncultured Gulosibacter sp.]
MVSTRTRLHWEIWIVLALAILPSSVSAIVALLETSLQHATPGDGVQQINPATSTFPIVDLLRRLNWIATSLAPVALAIWLLWTRYESGFHRLGIDWRGPRQLGRDCIRGVALAAVIGIPGLALYAVSRLVGVTPQVVTSDTSLTATQVALLVVAALRAALLEEIVVVGYLTVRLQVLGWSMWSILAVSALLRGSYHLYQGVGMALGNVVMGVLFAWLFLRGSRSDTFANRQRLAPLVIAHFTLDCVAFLGYPLAVALWPDLF